MSTNADDGSILDLASTTYDYEEARRLASEGVWSTALPDAPNIDPDDVVVMCVGPRPDDDRYDACAADAGSLHGLRWITLAMIGRIDGEVDMLTTSETTFLSNYRWTRAEATPLPVPETMAELIGIVSGTRTRSDDPLPAAAAHTVADAMIAASMEGHAGSPSPGSVIFNHFANGLLLVIGTVALAFLAIATDPERFSGIGRVVAVAAMVFAVTGVLVETHYRRELTALRRIPVGYEEGRARAASHLRTAWILAFLSGALLLMMSTFLV